MWRRNGDGEAYIYVPRNAQVPALCKTTGTVCDDEAGISLMRGAFQFTTGRWIKMAITGVEFGLVLNSAVFLSLFHAHHLLLTTLAPDFALQCN